MKMSNMTSNGRMTDCISRNQCLLNNWLAVLTSQRSQIADTVYDQPYSGIHPPSGIGDMCPRSTIFETASAMRYLPITVPIPI